MPAKVGPPGWAYVLSSTSIVLGPAKSRCRVRPLTLPTATPRTETLSLASLGLLGSRGMSIGLLRVTNAVSFGDSGMNAAAKYWSLVPAQSKGPGSVSPPLIHFFPVRKNPDTAALRSTLPFREKSIFAPVYDDAVLMSPSPLGHCV